MTLPGPYRCLALFAASAAMGLAACHKAPRPAEAPLPTAARRATLPADLGGNDTDRDHYGQAYAKPTAVSSTPPPAIPGYDQPGSPGSGFLWTPGYWAWAKGDYTWVPGAWVRPPRVGLLWTPGYWRWIDGVYGFIPGFWADKVGFYGGVNYGHGYGGQGYAGAKWRGASLAYNTAVTTASGLPADALYREAQPLNTNPVAFSGGPGGVEATPSLGDMAAARDPHEPPTPAQLLQVAVARAEPGQRASVNRDHPSVAATVTPTAFLSHRAASQAMPSLPYYPPSAPKTEQPPHP